MATLRPKPAARNRSDDRPWGDARYIRPADLARIAGLSRSLVYREITDGRIAFRVYGRARLIPVQEAERFLASIEAASTDAASGE